MKNDHVILFDCHLFRSVGRSFEILYNLESIPKFKILITHSLYRKKTNQLSHGVNITVKDPGLVHLINIHEIYFRKA